MGEHEAEETQPTHLEEKVSTAKAWVAGTTGVVLAALWVYQPAVMAGDVNAGTHLNAAIAALVSFGTLFGGTYIAPRYSKH